VKKNYPQKGETGKRNEQKFHDEEVQMAPKCIEVEFYSLLRKNKKSWQGTVIHPPDWQTLESSVPMGSLPWEV
jgi:hypothetical protein